MLSIDALNFHRRQYEQQGFTILLNAARLDLIRKIISTVALAHASDLIEGDESSHSWKEIEVKPPVALTEMITGVFIPDLIGGEPFRMAHWVNVYELGEYIGTHVDATGDAQIMIPIELPPDGDGGNLWVVTKQCILPVSVGDVLLFTAHRLRHGTTAVRSGRRVSFNARIWLR